MVALIRQRPLIQRLLLAGAALAPLNFVIGLPLGDTSLHPLEPWAALVIVATLLLEPRLFVDAFDAPTLLLWTTFVFVATSTLVATPMEYWTRGIEDLALLAMNFLAFTVTYGLLRADGAAWRRFAIVFFAASIVSSAFLSARALIAANSGVFLLPDSYMLGLGTVTGTYAAAFAAASVIGATFGATRRMRLLMLLGVIVHGMAATLALARGPWIALGLTAIVGLAMGVLFRIARPLTALFRWGVAVLVLLLVAVGTTRASHAVAEILAPRLIGVADVSTGTGLTRVTLFEALFTDAMRSPVFGNGAATYRRVAQLLGSQGSISENFLLEMFHAGGIAAALPLGIFSLVVLARLARVLRRSVLSEAAAVCLACMFALMLGALSNPAAWNTSAWVIAAMGAALYDVSGTPDPGERAMHGAQ